MFDNQKPTLRRDKDGVPIGKYKYVYLNTLTGELIEAYGKPQARKKLKMSTSKAGYYLAPLGRVGSTKVKLALEQLHLEDGLQ